MNLAVHVPVASEPVSVSPGHDHTFAIRVEALRANAAGVVLATLKGDSAPRRFDVAAGEVVAGAFVKIVYEHEGATTTLTGPNDLLAFAFSALPA